MTTTTPQPTIRRTPWDVILGLVLMGAGVFLLGNAVFATVVSIWIIGWTNLASGVVLLVASLFRLRSGGFWSAALGGAALVVIGLFVLRNPLVGAAALTLGSGVMFLVSGLTRIAWAFGDQQSRLVLLVSGLVSAGLGLYVLFNLGVATLTLLGVLLGVQTLLEGLSLIAIGRVRPAPTSR